MILLKYSYYRYFNKNKALCRGKKTDIIDSKKPITQREWKSASKKNRRKNPIKEGEKYLDCLNSNPDFNYRDVAEKFRVSKTRVSQMIALVRKLPKEILDYFNIENKSKISCFTERKLRPLTLLITDEEKINQFSKMINN